jgi:O-antigen ligase
MKEAQRLKLFFEKDNILELLFALFLGAFFMMESNNGHRIFFLILVVVPFIAFYRDQLFNETKSVIILLSSALMFLFLIGILWSNLEHEARIDKTLIKILSTYLLIQISFYYFSKRNLNTVLNILIACAVIACCISLFNYFSENLPIYTRLRNTLHNHHPVVTANLFAFALITLTFQSINYKNNKAIFIVLTLMGLILFSGIIMTHSRGAMLGLIISGLFVLSITRVRYLLIFLVVIALISLVYWQIEPSLFEKLFKRGSSGRLTIYKILIDRVSETKSFGLGTIADETIYFTKTFTSNHAHSSFLASYYHLGVFGFLLHLAIITTALYQSFILATKANKQLSLSLLVFGLVCLSVDGSYLIEPYVMEWLLFWIPVTLTAAQYNILIVKNNKHQT